MEFIDWKKKGEKFYSLEKYYRNRKKIPGMIDKFAPLNSTSHGSYAADKQLPKHLRSVRIQDRDIMVTPGQEKQIALMIEKQIEKQIGDHLEVVKSKKTPNVYKIKGKDGLQYADIMPYKKIKYKVIKGRRYRTLKDMRLHAEKMIAQNRMTHKKKQQLDFIRRANLAKARKALAKKRKPTRKKSGKKRSKSRGMINIWAR